MAYALKLDGVNDYLTTAAWQPTDQGEFSVEVELVTGLDISTDQFIVGNESGTYPRSWKMFVSGGKFGIIHNSNWTGGGIISSGNISTSTLYNVKATLSGGNFQLHLNNVLQGSSSRSTINKPSYLTTFGWRGTGSTHADISIITVDCKDLTTTSNNRFYDATSSSHAAGTPILDDTIGGNDATGVNMPTDGSAWINLGGSGISIAATLGTIEYNSNDTIVGLAGTVDVATTLGTINYSSQDATISLFGDIDLTATLGIIDYTSQSTIVSLSGAVDVNTTLGTIAYSSINTTIGLTGSVDVIPTLGTISYISNSTTISLSSETIINATLGAIDYTSQDTAVTLSGLIDITSTLGAIVYNSYPVIVSIGKGQAIGNVTTSFADNIYTAGFKPDTITVSFK